VWVAILAPGLVRRLRDRRSEVAVGEFHRHLRVLQRTGPAAMRPAFRLQHRAADRLDTPGVLGPDGAPTLTLVQPAATLVQRTVSDRARRGGTASAVRGTRPDPFFAPGACKRRRDVVGTLLSVVTASGLVGAIPGLHLVLAVTAAAVVVCALYLFTLARLRRRAVERVAKLRYLPDPDEEPSFVIVRRAAR
jgi:hypothetical protein